MSPVGTRLSGPGRVCLGGIDFIPVGTRDFTGPQPNQMCFRKFPLTANGK